MEKSRFRKAKRRPKNLPKRPDGKFTHPFSNGIFGPFFRPKLGPFFRPKSLSKCLPERGKVAHLHGGDGPVLDDDLLDAAAEHLDVLGGEAVAARYGVQAGGGGGGGLADLQ